MRLQIPCSCGQTIQLDPEIAGGHVNCPVCGRPYAVPVPLSTANARAGSAIAGQEERRDLTWLPILAACLIVLFLLAVVLWALLAHGGLGSSGLHGGTGSGTALTGGKDGRWPAGPGWDGR